MLNVCRGEQRRRSPLQRRRASGAGDRTAPGRWPELRASIAALPEQERRRLFLRYYADLSQDEIAEVLGVRPGTVGAALNHARAKLRTALGTEVTR